MLAADDEATLDQPRHNRDRFRIGEERVLEFPSPAGSKSHRALRPTIARSRLPFHPLRVHIFGKAMQPARISATKTVRNIVFRSIAQTLRAKTNRPRGRGPNLKTRGV